jgi:5-bromo-4-chloroindolyl phosphate hydrolysis protein
MLLRILEHDVQLLKSELERVKSSGNETEIALLRARLHEVEKDIEDLRKVWEASASIYVTLARYGPVEKIVFGLVGSALIALVGAVIGGVLN